MICPKCGIENSEDSVFCNKCGYKLSEEIIEEVTEEIIEKDNVLTKINKLGRKRTIIVFGSVLTVIIVALILMLYINNPVMAFKNNVKDNKYTEATKIYNEEIKGNKDKENSINEFLKGEISNIEKAFIDEKIDYDTAYNRLQTIKNTKLLFTDVNMLIAKINSINNSRIAFDKAEAFIKNKDLINAIKEYKNVISEDKNYGNAQEQITNYKIQYKEQVIKSAEESAISKDYNNAISLLKEATRIIENDIDLSTKISLYEEQLVKKLTDEQLVIVESAKILVQDSTYKYLYPDMIQVIMKNVSDKTIKDIHVGLLGYDKNGYPVKILFNLDFSGGSFEKVGYGENVNIVAGAKFGHNSGFELDPTHGISKVLACVKDVVFYDETTWENPYYEYWLNKYKEKPLN